MLSLNMLSPCCHPAATKHADTRHADTTHAPHSVTSCHVRHTPTLSTSHRAFGGNLLLASTPHVAAGATLQSALGIKDSRCVLLAGLSQLLSDLKRNSLSYVSTCDTSIVVVAIYHASVLRFVAGMMSMSGKSGLAHSSWATGEAAVAR